MAYNHICQKSFSTYCLWGRRCRRAEGAHLPLLNCGYFCLLHAGALSSLSAPYGQVRNIRAHYRFIIKQISCCYHTALDILGTHMYTCCQQTVIRYRAVLYLFKKVNVFWTAEVSRGQEKMKIQRFKGLNNAHNCNCKHISLHIRQNKSESSA